MNPFVIIIIIIGVASFCLLFVPYRSTLCFDNRPPGLLIRFRCLFLAICGLEWIQNEKGRHVQVIILAKPVIRFRIKPRARKPKAEEHSVEPHENKKPSIGKLCFMTRLIPSFPGFVRRVLGSIRIQHFEMNGWFGLGDPRLTGYAFGLATFMHPMVGESISVSVAPDFMQRRLEGRVCLDFQFMLFIALWAMIVFGIQALRTYLKCKR